MTAGRSGHRIVRVAGITFATAAALVPAAAAHAADTPPPGKSYWIYGGSNVNGGAMLVERRGNRIAFSSVQGYHAQCFSGVQRANGLVVGKTLDVAPKPFGTTFRVQRTGPRMKFFYTGAPAPDSAWKRVGRAKANAHRSTDLNKDLNYCKRQPWA